MATKKTFISGTELARLTGVTRQYISSIEKQGRVYRDKVTGKFDPLHPTNSSYINQMQAKTGKTDEEIFEELDSMMPEGVSEGAGDVYTMKAIEETKRIMAARRKLDIDNAKALGNLIPVEYMRLWMGFFDSGIRNNILQIGNRVARGDIKLRDKIEAETKRAIEKTRDGVEAQLREYRESLRLAEEKVKEYEKSKRNKKKKR